MKYPSSSKSTSPQTTTNRFARGDTPEFRFLIARDTREQIPWEFEGDFEHINKKLRVGDYTLAMKLEGQIRTFENLFVVERKGSALEMLQMVAQERERWTRELHELARIPYAFIVCEFTLEEFLQAAVESEVNPAAAFGSITAWQFEAPVIFAGDRRHAEETFLCLARKVWKKFYLGHAPRKRKKSEKD